LSSGDKEKLHEAVVQIERDFNALSVNDSIKEAQIPFVEIAKMYEEFVNFYDYFSVDGNGGKDKIDPFDQRKEKILKRPAQ
jgi:hypothetical protein